MGDLSNYGWAKQHERDWAALDLPGLRPARVIADFGTSLKIALPEIVTAELSGKLAHYTKAEDSPKVADWVAVRLSDSGTATVETVVMRANEIARKVAGKQTLKQIVATNVDVAFVLLALDNDFSVERLKRFLYQLSVNAIRPVIVLNKADKADDVASYVVQLEQLAIPIIISTAIEGSGVEEIASHIPKGATAILLGSSGVGKSTLTNKLLGRDAQQTKEVRTSDSTGMHTTVHRELFMLPNGGLLIDTPGVRELQLWGTEEDLVENYDDIIALAAHCKYTNCQHQNEQGCAIQEALTNGTLEKKHYDNYIKMKTELVALAERKAERERNDNKRRRKSNTMRRFSGTPYVSDDD